jgi:hypothetical protein
LEPEHLESLNADKRTQFILPGDCAYTLMKDDRPIAAGGIYRIFDNYGIVWTVFSEECKNSALLMRRAHRAAQVKFAEAVEEMKLAGAECFANVKDAKACHWPLSFGFKDEGEVRRFVWTK